MDEALRWLASRRPESPSLGIILADQQTKGRGTRQRFWHSPEGNLFVSFAFEIPLSYPNFSQLSVVGAVALGEALCAQYPSLDVGYKWPNDMIVDGKKVAGILTETYAQNRSRWVLVGMGVNLQSAPLLSGTYEAGSLFSLTGEPCTPFCFLEALVPLFDRFKNLWLKEGFLRIAEKWHKRALYIGKIIRVVTAQGSRKGIFRGIDSQGFLRLELLSSGEEVVLSAGSITCEHDALKRIENDDNEITE
jgi:BirA family biotin operon repressor/biotin-[acetyl-CoA-carboxylase] ligase